MRDFFYAAQVIGNNNPISAGKSSLVRYFKLDGSAFVPETDSSQYGRNSQGWGGTNSSAPGLPAPGYLLDQHQVTTGVCFQAGHGFSNLFSWNGNQDAGVDNFQNKSWSLVFAGLKPHDMSVNRTWHGIGSGTDIGGTVQINSDGTLVVTSNVANSASSAAGVIQQYVPHLIIISYDNSVQKITVWVGDWNGRWVTAINAASAAAISANAPFPLMGRSRSGTVAADGFLDDYCAYIGYALTAADANSLFVASGYNDGVISYPRSRGHRNGPFNNPYPGSQAIDANSAAAVTEFAAKADGTAIPGAGSFNPTSSSTSQFTTSIYVVDGSFRKNPANWQKIVGPSHYGDQTQVMSYEDMPLPFSGRPSLGFAPSAGSDGHACLYCPDTDEYWDMGVLTNAGTDAAPVWHTVYGNKQTGFSLFLGAFSNGQGATATGIPNMLGIPSAAELQNAIYNGVPIPHGLAVVCFDGLAANVFPANRHDGGKVGSNVIEGQGYRLKHDAPTSALIAAMPHTTGRAMATASQTFGMFVVDRNLFDTLLETEDFHSATAYNGGINPYTHDPVGEPALGGILNGQTFSSGAMTNFPWPNLELMDHAALDPTAATQAIRPTVTGLSGQHTASAITLTWSDDALVQWWNIYLKTSISVTLSTLLSTGGAITSIGTAALTQPIPSGSQVTLKSGVNSQTFTLSALAKTAATSLTVASQTPNFAYPTSTTVVVRSLIQRTYWPKYTVVKPPTAMTFAITAVNGGGESIPSLDFTPPLPLQARKKRQRTTFG